VNSLLRAVQGDVATAVESTSRVRLLQGNGVSHESSYALCHRTAFDFLVFNSECDDCIEVRKIHRGQPDCESERQWVRR